MNLPNSIKSGHKVIGYFAYTEDGQVFCDGDGCIISCNAKKMQSYLESEQNISGENWIIKKTRFGEIIEGLKQGGAYAFDEASYEYFLELAKKNGIRQLPNNQLVKEHSDSLMHLIRIQMVG